jgi:UDPglucose 6-dehydrogenase
MVTNKKMVAVVGLWHLGCTVSACLAEQGYKVVGIDTDPVVVEGLKRAEPPLFEPGLADLIKSGMSRNDLEFSLDFKSIAKCKFVVLACDIPVDNQDRVIMNSFNRLVGKIKKNIRSGTTLIVMSQVPAGTCRKIYIDLKKKVEVVCNPENLRLGSAVKTFLQADRMVVGTATIAGVRSMKEFYGYFKNPILFMSLESAEMVKHGINAFLACSISLIGQITAVAEAVGANMKDVAAGLRSDSRIGQQARVMPGLGFAGGTLGRDVQTLKFLAKKHNLKVPLIADIYSVNSKVKDGVVKKIGRIAGGLKNKKICILGLVYKPKTSTLRRSFSLEVAKELVRQGSSVKAFDPALGPKSGVPSSLSLYTDPYEAIRNTDICVILTAWPEFSDLNFKKISRIMRHRVVYDAQNMLNPVKLKKSGLYYYGTGV